MTAAPESLSTGDDVDHGRLAEKRDHSERLIDDCHGVDRVPGQRPRVKHDPKETHLVNQADIQVEPKAEDDEKGVGQLRHAVASLI